MLKNSSPRVLITGAQGFVGRYLVDALQAQFPNSILYTDRIEITDQKAVEKTITDFAPDTCIHLAGVSNVNTARQNFEKTWQINLNGSLNIGRAILEKLPACRLIYASTADAWGGSFKSGIPIDENTALAPMNTYAASKAAADLALGAMAFDGLQVVRFRPFNHTGPGQNPNFVVPAFARQIAQIEQGKQPPIIKVGNLSPKRDFLDVRDVVQAYIKAACGGYKIPSGAILPLCSGETRSIKSILDELIELSKVKAHVEEDNNLVRSVDIPIAHGNSITANKIIDWKPTVPWSKTLEDIFLYWKNKIHSEN
ncbi:GDP-mannose 4,6-dehydratase [Zymomonas mobilis]|uniref:GDP-mannose 4,6-dehydratase n=1 Tax=Zymomonas mobilis TaxID=542 RepID=UPI0003C75B31|nr:GDP-mannose 4,6-dehydratase [Zymomonas mobilis]AHB09440.1 nucleoside-diphosphate-sugar epimerase [Zymomonas mobilis subsp. mobilis str. CP4 = NRRL B-14023]AHJ69746.1 CDP-paratose 2-epimerase [Zymomonas mobilis subsp. mobilis NRRL B-12526]AHJ71602.1 CDP-paratose 2-epimerase [Zymomonas mobilis subsp. mobilis str. CP4 = NRRL B-14023]MCP9307821.1 GDP-mannose 4,6-dehydratase [Zymomonas mobilis]